MKKREFLEILSVINIPGLKPEELLNLNSEDVEIILKNKENKNIDSIVTFLIDYKINEKQFLRLEIDNAKGIIVDRLKNISDKSLINYLLKHFDYEIDKIQTKEEWLTFIRVLSEKGIFDKYNLAYVLENITTYRVETIEKVMLLPRNVHINKSHDYDLDLDGKTFLDYLDLISLGYRNDCSKEFVEKKEENDKINIFIKKQKDNEKAYYNALEYLKAPTVFNEYLPRAFTRKFYGEYNDIIDLLKQIQDEKLLAYYLCTYFPYKEEEIIREYIKIILGTDSPTLKEAYLNLLYSDTISEISKENRDKKMLANIKTINNLSAICKTLERFDEENGKSVVMSKLYSVLPRGVWDLISPTSSEEVLNFILGHRRLAYFDAKILVELTKLSIDEIKTFNRIIETKSFKKKENIQDEAFRILYNRKKISLEDFYTYYLKKDEELKRVQEQIEEFDEEEKTNETSNIETMKRILANYDDEDEITSKILTYKKV